MWFLHGLCQPIHIRHANILLPGLQREAQQWSISAGHLEPWWERLSQLILPLHGHLHPSLVTCFIYPLASIPGWGAPVCLCRLHVFELLMYAAPESKLPGLGCPWLGGCAAWVEWPHRSYSGSGLSFLICMKEVKMRKKFRRTRPRRKEKEGKDGGEIEEPVGTRILAKDFNKSTGWA